MSLSSAFSPAMAFCNGLYLPCKEKPEFEGACMIFMSYSSSLYLPSCLRPEENWAFTHGVSISVLSAFAVLVLDQLKIESASYKRM